MIYLVALDGTKDEDIAMQFSLISWESSHLVDLQTIHRIENLKSNAKSYNKREHALETYTMMWSHTSSHKSAMVKQGRHNFPKTDRIKHDQT